MAKRFGHFALALIFFLFAYFQWNDPDPIVWIIVYSIVGLIALAYGMGIHSRRVSGIILFLMMIGLASYVPDFIQWISDGTPDITSTMKASSPFIENTREFFGLALSAMVLGFYCYKSS